MEPYCGMASLRESFPLVGSELGALLTVTVNNTAVPGAAVSLLCVFLNRS